MNRLLDSLESFIGAALIVIGLWRSDTVCVLAGGFYLIESAINKKSVQIHINAKTLDVAND